MAGTDVIVRALGNPAHLLWLWPCPCTSCVTWSKGLNFSSLSVFISKTRPVDRNTLDSASSKASTFYVDYMVLLLLGKTGGKLFSFRIVVLPWGGKVSSANIPVGASWEPGQFLVHFWAYFSLSDASWLHFEDAVGFESYPSIVYMDLPSEYNHTIWFYHIIIIPYITEKCKLK